MRAALLLLLLLALAAVALGGCSEPPPNIALVVVDTVRADRLSCYGYRRPTSPRIDELCARGIRFDNASSTSSWTLPAHASLFTGRFPIEHGATQEHTVLEEGLPTLAALLSARGYATFGVSANPVVNRNSGLARGFGGFVESYRTRPVPGKEHPNQTAVRDFLDGLRPDQPFFFFANYIEAHGPYSPPEPFRKRFLSVPADDAAVEEALRRRPVPYYLDRSAVSMREFAVLNDLYDGEIAHVDHLVGELVDALEATGRLSNTVIVVTSDHGENIGDHGHFRHIFSLYGTTVRVPLILVLPGDARAGEVVSEPVGLLDLFATVLALAGVEPSDGSHGRDLLALPEGEVPIFAEYYYPLQALGLFGPDGADRHRQALLPYLRRLRSVERDGMRLVWSSDGNHELFDLARDPGERSNLAGQPEAAEHEARLHALLEDYVKRAGGPRPLPSQAGTPKAEGAFGDLDEESADLLRELGYLP